MDRFLRLLGFRCATAALVLVAVAALYGAAALSRPDGPARAATGTRAPVTTAISVCPGGEDSRVSVQSPPGTSRTGPGRADVIPTRGGAPVGSLSAPGGIWSKDLTKTRDSATVRAYGPVAAGLAAEQTTHWPKGSDRGLAGIRCASPGTDQWFVGPGPAAVERLDLYVTNVDARPAVVDVTALSGEGPLETPEGRGTPIEPYATKIVKLGRSPEGMGDILATARDVALRVRSTTGRVAASVRVRSGKERGIDWLPLSPAPATSLVLPGIPGGSGKRQLLVGVPGEADARVRVRAITGNGTITPQGQNALDAPAGSITTLDLERTLAGKAAAVRVDSDRPVVAGFALQRGADIGYGTATAPLGAEGGVVADNRFESWLSLTAPDRAATVRITPVGPQGPAAARDVAVPAGRTTEIRVAGPPGAASYGLLVVPKPGSGTLHAARSLTTGKGDSLRFTVLPIVPSPTTMWLPPVKDSPGTLGS